MKNDKLVVHPLFDDQVNSFTLVESNDTNESAFDSKLVEEHIEKKLNNFGINNYRVDLKIKGFYSDQPPEEKFFYVENTDAKNLYLYFGHCAVRRYRSSAQKEIGLQVSNPHYLKCIDKKLALNAFAIGIYQNTHPKSPRLYYIFKISEWFESDNFSLEDCHKRNGAKETSSNSFFANHELDSLPALNSEKGMHFREADGRKILTFTEVAFNEFVKNISNINSYFGTNSPNNDRSYDQSYPQNSIQLSKPFILLAGISGTGKSRFVREQARLSSTDEASDGKPENFEIVSVRPDWHEPSDLLGYVTRLSGKPQFVSTDVLKFMVRAWKAIAPSVEEFKDGKFTFKADLKPFWLCLDEMNLSPVEQYFADYLSVLETRKIEGDLYNCDPLIKPTLFDEVLSDIDELSDEYKDRKKTLAKSLGLESSNELFEAILKNGIPLPYNLIVAGTVNMDETTHGFSRKVIDRALTLDFGEFYPSETILGDNFNAFFETKVTDKKLSYPTATSPENVFTQIAGVDAGKLSYNFFNKVNFVLKGTVFELAYRALKELLLAVQSFDPKSQDELCAVWDDFLMMKVLPRIEGDEDKLAFYDKNDKGEFVYKHDLLKELEDLLSGTQALSHSKEETKSNTGDLQRGDESIDSQIDDNLKSSGRVELEMLKPIWEGKVRPDLLREVSGNIECRSRKKIEQMQAKLKRGFTSFWP